MVDRTIHHSGCRRVNGKVPGNAIFPRTSISTTKVAGWWWCSWS